MRCELPAERRRSQHDCQLMGLWFVYESVDRLVGSSMDSKLALGAISEVQRLRLNEWLSSETIMGERRLLLSLRGGQK